MIDFRYHIVSIVAVLLALSAGVVLGSGLIGGPLLDDIQRRADDIRATNDELRELAEDRLARLEAQDDFAEAVKAYLLPGSLEGTRVAIIEVQGIPQELREGITTTIGEAGGQVAGTVRLLDELDLDDGIRIDELALALGSVSGDADDLRLQLASTLADRLSAAARTQTGGPAEQAAARSRLEDLLSDLAEPGFVEVDRPAQGALVPTGAAFVILSGASEEPRYEVEPVVTRLAADLGADDMVVVVGEPEGSLWDIVPSIRENSDISSLAATVTGADTPFGRVAFVLTLSAALEGAIGHHGVGSGEAVLPSPEPSPTSEE